MNRSKQPTPIATFRIYPRPKGRLYVTTYIWRTLKDLRDSNPGNSHALGLCKEFLRISCPKNAPERLHPEFAEVHFCKHHCRIGIITHEFTHALLAWAARTKCVPDLRPITKTSESKGGTHKWSSPEEQLPYAMGNMVKECVWQLYHRKILK